MAESTYRKQWRLDNPEKVAAIKKRSYEKNKERILAQQREYVQANKEAKAAYAKEYRLKNKEKLAEQKKQYKKDNAELFRGYNRARKALKRNAEWDGWKDADVWARDNDTCQICFELVPKDLTNPADPMYPAVDHIIGLAQGGSHLFGNVRLTHNLCNNSRTREQERSGR